MKGNHILYNLNSYGGQLPLFVNELKDQLAKRIDMPSEKLDFSPDSIYELDMYLMTIQEQIDEDFVVENIIRITAYLNEVYVRNNNGRWSIELHEDGVTWCPIVISSTGERRQYYSYIYENLMYEDMASINSCYFSGGSPA